MTDNAAPSMPPSPARPAGRAARCHDAAFALLLACMAARCFLAELPWQGSALQFLPDSALAAPRAGDGPEANAAAYQADRSELARVTFAVLVLSGVAIWALGGALGGELRVRRAGLALAILVLAALLLASACQASDRRAALSAWLEQVSFLAAAFLAVQLCADRRRFGMLLAVMAAVGVTVALKGLWQRAVEIPQRVADFDAHGVERLRDLGWDPHSPQGVLFEGRLRDPSITGFGSLANPFGSMLLVLGFAAAGLAMARFMAARRLRRDAPARRRGEIHLPTLAAGLAGLAALLVLIAVPLTRSRGAMGAGAAAAVGLIVALALRDRLARHWRKCALGLAGAVLLGGAGVAAYGLTHDRLPTRTMTFRWHYWTASARIVRQRPWLGVGPGNFATAYLQHRRDDAEEEVRMPHNLIAHALAEYGLPGGLCFLGVVGWLLVGCARPRTTAQDPGAGAPPGVRRGDLVFAAVVLAVVAARAVFWESPGGALLLVLGLAGPASVLAGVLPAIAWSGSGGWGVGGEGPGPARAALGWGAFGFVLHNAVTYSLWMPAMATVFYVAVGASVAQGDGRPSRSLRRGRWLVAAGTIAAVLAAAIALWLPVQRKTSLTAAMLAALRRGDVPAAWRQAEAAVEADPLDPRPAADAARVCMMSLPQTPPPAVGPVVARAASLADEAIRRDPANSAGRQLAAGIRWALLGDGPRLAVFGEGDAAYQAGNDDEARRLWAQATPRLPRGPAADRAVEYMRQAVALNPKDSRLRIRFAEQLCLAGRPREGLRQAGEALRLDGRLPPDSVQRLRPDERFRFAMLQARATLLVELALIGPAATAPRSLPHDHDHEGHEGDHPHDGAHKHGPGCGHNPQQQGGPGDGGKGADGGAGHEARGDHDHP